MLNKLHLSIKRHVFISESRHFAKILRIVILASGYQQIIDIGGIVLRDSTNFVLIEELLYIGLTLVNCTADRTFDMRKIILSLFHLFNLNLMNILTDLFCQKIAQLITDVISLVKLNSQHIRIITLTDKNILASTFTNFNRQG